MRREISLRDIVEMILKRKLLVCIITVVAMLISGLYSFLIMEPIYSASSTLLTNPIESKRINLTDGINEVVDSLAIYPDMSIDTYKEQVINSTVLGNTINELKLTNSKGKPMQWSGLASKISVNIVENTNLLKITVRDKDPEMAAKISNSIAENFIKYISNNTKKFGEQATSIIEELLKDEERKLEEEAKKLQDYVAKSRNVEQLKLEVQSLYTRINTYNMEIIELEKQIVADNEALKVILGGKSTFSGIDLNDDIKINVPLGEGDAYQDIEISFDSTNKLQNSLVTIKATELETRLIQNRAERDSLVSKVKELENGLIETQNILAEEEHKYNAVNRTYNLAEQTYNAYLERHKEALLAATSNIGESAMIITSPATIPIEPSSRGKLFYVALGSMIGLMTGVFLALLIADWKNTENKRESN